MAKLKVLKEIEALFHRTGEEILSFDTIMSNIDERRSTLLGVLSSNKKVLQNCNEQMAVHPGHKGFH